MIKTSRDDSDHKGYSQLATTARITNTDRNTERDSYYNKISLVKTTRGKFHSLDARFANQNRTFSKDTEESETSKIVPNKYMADHFKALSPKSMKKTQSSIRITNTKFNFDKLVNERTNQKPNTESLNILQTKVSERNIRIQDLSKIKISHKKNLSIPILKFKEIIDISDIEERDLNNSQQINLKTESKSNILILENTGYINIKEQATERSQADPFDFKQNRIIEKRIIANEEELLRVKILEKYSQGRFDKEAEDLLKEYIYSNIERTICEHKLVIMDFEEVNLDEKFTHAELKASLKHLCSNEHDFTVFMEKYMEIKGISYKNKLEFDSAFIQEILKDLVIRYLFVL